MSTVAPTASTPPGGHSAVPVSGSWSSVPEPLTVTRRDSTVTLQRMGGYGRVRQEYVHVGTGADGRLADAEAVHGTGRRAAADAYFGDAGRLGEHGRGRAAACDGDERAVAEQAARRGRRIEHAAAGPERMRGILDPTCAREPDDFRKRFYNGFGVQCGNKCSRNGPDRHIGIAVDHNVTGTLIGQHRERDSHSPLRIPSLRDHNREEGRR